jgi:hypothetical protein
VKESEAYTLFTLEADWLLGDVWEIWARWAFLSPKQRQMILDAVRRFAEEANEEVAVNDSI